MTGCKTFPYGGRLECLKYTRHYFIKTSIYKMNVLIFISLRGIITIQDEK